MPVMRHQSWRRRERKAVPSAQQGPQLCPHRTFDGGAQNPSAWRVHIGSKGLGAASHWRPLRASHHGTCSAPLVLSANQRRRNKILSSGPITTALTHLLYFFAKSYIFLCEELHLSP